MESLLGLTLGENAGVTGLDWRQKWVQVGGGGGREEWTTQCRHSVEILPLIKRI